MSKNLYCPTLLEMYKTQNAFNLEQNCFMGKKNKEKFYCLTDGFGGRCKFQ